MANTPTDALPTAFTTKEVAIALRCRLQRVRQLIGCGLLRAYRLDRGAPYLIYREDLTAYMEQHALAGRPDSRRGRRPRKSRAAGE